MAQQCEAAEAELERERALNHSHRLTGALLEAVRDEKDAAVALLQRAAAEGGLPDGGGGAGPQQALAVQASGAPGSAWRAQLAPGGAATPPRCSLCALAPRRPAAQPRAPRPAAARAARCRGCAAWRLRSACGCAAACSKPRSRRCRRWRGRRARWWIGSAWMSGKRRTRLLARPTPAGAPDLGLGA